MVTMNTLKQFFQRQWRALATFRLFWADYRRFLGNAGFMGHITTETSLARIVMAYHVIEKGLTMPHRRMGFGVVAIANLIELIEGHVRRFGAEHPQIRHAIGVVRAYDEMHQPPYDRSHDDVPWDKITDFLSKYESVPSATQRHMTLETFFANLDAPFPMFAHSRHTLRHYDGPVDIEVIRHAVELAQTAPSACNRQHVRVHCISNHELRDKILSHQNGNRGFGHLADKLLVVTSDLADLRWRDERRDIYVNGGIFLMNLCYALHYEKVAHCILNCSLGIEAESCVRGLLNLNDSEVLIAMVACGKPPEEFDIADSPRRPMADIFTELA